MTVRARKDFGFLPTDEITRKRSAAKKHTYLPRVRRLLVEKDTGGKGLAWQEATPPSQ